MTSQRLVSAQEITDHTSTGCVTNTEYFVLGSRVSHLVRATVHDGKLAAGMQRRLLAASTAAVVVAAAAVAGDAVAAAA